MLTVRQNEAPLLLFSGRGRGVTSPSYYGRDVDGQGGSTLFSASMFFSRSSGVVLLSCHLSFFTDWPYLWQRSVPPLLPHRRRNTNWSILSTCVISMWRNVTKCKYIYMFMFPLKNLARKGLSPGYDLCVSSGYIIVLYKALMSCSPEWRGLNFQNWVIFDPGADLAPPPGGHFENANELLNLRALKISILY